MADNEKDCALEEAGHLSYKIRLNDIGKELGEGDLDALKFLCADVIPLSRREAISTPMDLFRELERSDEVSVQNGDFLLECLMHIHRQDLLKKLGYDVKDLEKHIKGQNKVTSFRLCLFQFTEELLDEDLETIILVYSCKAKKLKKVTTVFSAFTILEQEGFIHEGDISSLEEVFRAIDRKDLIERVKKRSSQGSMPSQAPKSSNSQRLWSLTNRMESAGDQVSKVSTTKLEQNFKSRFQDDFTVLDKLGSGGFAVVFKAYQKFDEQEYAIKRMAVSSTSERTIERVKREVKALAKLDHPNIVRYFHSWIEEPPPGWQESQDTELQISLSEAPSTLDTTSTKDSSSTESSYQDNNDTKSDSSNNIIFGDTNAGGDASNVWPYKSDNQYPIMDANTSNNDYYEDIRTGINELTTDETENDETTQNKNKDKKVKIYLYIQMQLCKKETLEDWIATTLDRESESQRHKMLQMFQQIISAVDYIHEKKMIHRDIKPSNIFFSFEDQIKLGDFGLAQTLMQEQEGEPSESSHRKLTSGVGTRSYMSPEQLGGKNYTEKVDIYALGLTLFEMSYIFSTKSERAFLWDKIRNRQFPDSFRSDYMYDIVMGTLSRTPDDRPSCKCLNQSIIEAYS